MSKSSTAFQAFADQFLSPFSENLPAPLRDALPDAASGNNGLPAFLAELIVEEDAPVPLAGAKPEHAGGGKTGGGKTDPDSTDGGTTSKGKGKKSTPDTDPDTGTDPDGGTGGTDPDTGGTDPVPTDYVAADYVSGLDTPDGFNIAIIFDGDWTAAQRAELEKGAELLSDIIIGDVADTVTSKGLIDDILVTATMMSIDGAGGFAGYGGFTAVHSDGSNLPSMGFLQLDSADAGSLLNGGILDDFMVHEILHALGFGTLWGSKGLTETIDNELRFTGANAIEAYNDAYADKAASDPLSHLGVPVEMDGGGGTAGVHWDEAVFGDEIMTGYLNWTNNTSDITIASLEDLGYETVYGNDPLV